MAGFAADMVVVAHLLFVVFVMLGGLLVPRWSWVAIFHLPAVLWGIAIELFGWICPLTPLELELRQRAGQAGYDEGFIQHYIWPLLYPDDLTRSLQLVLAGVVVLVNLIVYGYVVYSRFNSTTKRPADL